MLHSGREQDVTAVGKAIAQELLTLGLHRSLSVTVSSTRMSDKIPYVVIYLGNQPSQADPDTASEISYEIARGATIFPVVSDLEDFGSEVPEVLAHANGFAWNDDASLRRLTRLLMEELGIEERQRRVFISHRRDDGLGAAEQIHDELTHLRFQPFIDRFAIRKAADVQAEIADALEDHAFLLLLETPLAHKSDWVYDEVDYALSHAMGVLIVRWPGEVVEVPGSSGIPRLQIHEDELVDDEHNFSIFTDAAIDRIVERVEEAHALGIVRRRRALVKSIEESARAAGFRSCISLKDWRLLVETHDGRLVVGTTPRLPNATDLQGVDVASTDVAASLPGLLVHSARQIPEHLHQHLSWVSGDRKMNMIPENAVGGWWASGN